MSDTFDHYLDAIERMQNGECNEPRVSKGWYCTICFRWHPDSHQSCWHCTLEMEKAINLVLNGEDK